MKRNFKAPVASPAQRTRALLRQANKLDKIVKESRTVAASISQLDDPKSALSIQAAAILLEKVADLIRDRNS